MKNIVISGASRGIGRELVKIYLENGHNVIAFSRNKAKLEELEKYAENGQYHPIGVDLSDYKQIEKVLKVTDNLEHIDVLYNNAGHLVNKPFIDVTKEDLQKSWEVNFLAPYRLIQLLLPGMDNTSHIVNVSTMGAVQGSVKFPGLSAYSSSKAATANLTELLAAEFFENGPRINCIALGAVQTEMLEEAFPGYKAPLLPEEMASYLYDFGLNGHKFFNGKILQASVSTP